MTGAGGIGAAIARAVKKRGEVIVHDVKPESTGDEERTVIAVTRSPAIFRSPTVFPELALRRLEEFGSTC